MSEAVVFTSADKRYFTDAGLSTKKQNVLEVETNHQGEVDLVDQEEGQEAKLVSNVVRKATSHESVQMQNQVEDVVVEETASNVMKVDTWQETAQILKVEEMLVSNVKKRVIWPEIVQMQKLQVFH